LFNLFLNLDLSFQAPFDALRPHLSNPRPLILRLPSPHLFKLLLFDLRLISSNYLSDLCPPNLYLFKLHLLNLHLSKLCPSNLHMPSP
jgi:hypothetical protein